MQFETTNNVFFMMLLGLITLITLIALVLVISYLSKHSSLFLQHKLQEANGMSNTLPMSSFNNSASILTLFLSTVLLSIFLIGIISLFISGILSLSSSNVFAVLMTTACLVSITLSILFKDSFQNSIAGIMILFKPSFHVGDEIKLDNLSGKVTKISIQNVSVKTHDAATYLIPNTMVRTSVLTVFSAPGSQRFEYELIISINLDIEVLKKNLKKSIIKTNGVEAEPGVQTNVIGINDKSVTIQVCWWIDSSAIDPIVVRSDVMHSIKEALSKTSLDRLKHNQIQPDVKQSLNVKALNLSKQSDDISRNTSFLTNNEYHKS